MMRLVSLAAVAALSFGALPVFADSALLIGNTRYENGARIREGRAVLAAAEPLQSAGFQVIQGTGLDAAGIRQGMSQLLAQNEQQRIIIALSGHFAHSADGETWFLGVDANMPDRGNVGAAGVSLSTVMAIAAEAPGRAIILLGTEDRRMPLGRGLERGVILPDPPQGVAVVVGPAGDVAEIVWSELMDPGTSLVEALARFDQLDAVGFLADGVPFLERPVQAGAAPVVSPPAVGPSIDPEERALWDSAVTLDTAGAYEAYLRRYPNGIFAGEARARLATQPDDATRAAEAAEEALGLSRNARREIQRALSLLGFDTGGVDGIFGPATRRAISNWQVAQRIEATGFLTDISMDLLLQQFNDRRAEFEAQDRAFWNSVGSRGDEAGLRAYLDRFPQGIFAGEAQRRLDDLDVGRDLDAWAEARATATRAAYESYLQNFPDGRFASEA
ncbi:MAG: peptidoglycan-binding protein, partial [Pseudomonadota bacterium]